VSLSKTITSEDEFRSALPRHATAVFAYVEREPVLKLQRWAFARAVVRRPDLATVLFIASSGAATDVWLSVAPNGDGGWSVLPVKNVTAGGTPNGQSEEKR
jgi:hypothetical protein